MDENEDIVLIEAAHGEGEDKSAAPRAWRVQLIRAGVSANGNNYPLEVLHEAASRYEGVRALARGDDEHLSGRGKHARNIVGWIDKVIPTPKGLDGMLNLVESAGWLREMLWDGWKRGQKNLVGLSHVADAKTSFARGASGLVRNVQKIAKVDFVDVVINPSAGGEIVGLAESENGRSEIMLMERLLKLIEALDPVRYKAIDQKAITEDGLVQLLEAIQAEKSAAATNTGTTEPAKPDPALSQLAEAIKEIRTELKTAVEGGRDAAARERSVMLCESTFAGSGLPPEALERILAKVNGTEKPATKTEIESFIAAEAKYLGITQGWKGPGSSGRSVTVTRDVADKQKKALDGLVSGQAHVKLSESQGDVIPSYRSLRESFRDLTGLDPLDGGLNSPLVGLAEAAIQSSTFAGALGDSIRRQMQAEYNLAPYNSWRRVFEVANVPDFRTQYRPQTGAFPLLSSVSQNADYTEFATYPGEFTPAYAVTKYGNLQALTMETIVNDDIGFVRRIPVELGRAAARTVEYYAFYPLTNNTTLTYHLGGGTTDVTSTYYGPFSATTTARGPSGNLGAAALSMASLLAGRLVIMKNTVVTSATGGTGGPRVGIAPKFLLIPMDLEQLAFELCYAQYQPTLNNLAAGQATDNAFRGNFILRNGIEPVVMTQETDATDWMLLTDPKDVPTVEVGFLGGRQEPELFIADTPMSDPAKTSGGMFTADRVVYKVRMIFGTCVKDYRGMYKSAT